MYQQGYPPPQGYPPQPYGAPQQLYAGPPQYVQSYPQPTAAPVVIVVQQGGGGRPWHSSECDICAAPGGLPLCLYVVLCQPCT
jgi:hypothetical protein